jgi:uncharacterized membrane protein
MNALTVLRRRWPAVILTASLMLNAFLIGMVVVDWVKPHPRFSGERFATFELRRFNDRLPKEAADQIATELKPLGPELSDRIEELRAIREDIIQMAAEPNPDRAAIDARLAALRATASSMQETIQQATYDALLSLPPETRASLRSTPKS